MVVGAEDRAQPQSELSAVRVPKAAELIAAELRGKIVRGVLQEGDRLGPEQELQEQFNVSRPTLREAFRILESEALITVVRGSHGGVIIHEPKGSGAARSLALLLQSRNVTLADVYEARTIIEPPAARILAERSGRQAAVRGLRACIEDERAVIEDPHAFAGANTRFHEQLVAHAGNRTVSVVAEMLHDLVERAVEAVSESGSGTESVSTRRRGIKAQARLVDLIESGQGDEAEEDWRRHMEVVGRVMLKGQRAETVIDLLDHPSQ